jgi:DNA mismatch endonuclease, patch repair protein
MQAGCVQVWPPKSRAAPPAARRRQRTSHCLTLYSHGATLVAMVDIVAPEVRSRMMAGIRSKNTAPELLLRRHLFAAGFRFRLHVRGMPGRPDLVFPRFRSAVFVHGCFWHQHQGCRYATTPASNAEFWKRKFADNRARDARSIAELISHDWRVLTVWECELSGASLPATCSRVAEWLDPLARKRR